MITKFNTNNFRLFLKTIVTAWVPIVVAVFPDLFPTTLSAVAVMGASTITIDAFFRVFGVSDDVPLTQGTGY